jgi:hypothetical protein
MPRPYFFVTVTVVVAVAVLPAASVAVNVTVHTPIGYTAVKFVAVWPVTVTPAGTAKLTSGAPQLSVPFGFASVTLAG